LTIWSGPYNSKGMLRTVSDNMCEAVISSLGGSSSKGTPLQRSLSLAKHSLSRWRRTPSGAWPRTTNVIPHLLKLWREKKHVLEAIEAPPRTAADRWLLHYEQFLDQVCGVAASTRQAYRRMAKRFLGSCCGTGHLAWSSWQAQQITNCVQQEAATKHGGGRRLPSPAVRSVLRFLVCRGDLSPGLEAAARAPRWGHHDAIPPSLTAQEGEQALAFYAGETPTDLRTRAMLMLLAGLGLRAHEVISWCLEDINWQVVYLLAAGNSVA
jgi:integrase